eukprot:4983215-Amphidinium_carterae.1
MSQLAISVMCNIKPVNKHFQKGPKERPGVRLYDRMLFTWRRDQLQSSQTHSSWSFCGTAFKALSTKVKLNVATSMRPLGRAQ